MKKLWEIAEALTQQVFKLNPVSGSGRGPFGKGDATSEVWQVDTKSTEKGSFAVNFKEMKKYELQAAKERKDFFLHIVPHSNGKISNDRYVVVHEKIFKSMLDDISTLLR
jgi:hypothetical protein